MNQTNWMLRKILDVYKDSSLWAKAHIFVRYKCCPFLRLIDYMPREGNILDLGCGHGVLINLFWIAGFRKGTLIGTDLSERVIEIARRTVNGKNMKFYTQDISDIDEDHVDCITIIDVFYLLPPNVRNEIIDKCYRKLPKNGLLLIKDVQKQPYWKYCFCVLQETIWVKLLRVTRTKDYRFYFVEREEFVQTLKRKGFEVNVVRLDEGYPYPHVLYLCKKV